MLTTPPPFARAPKNLCSAFVWKYFGKHSITCFSFLKRGAVLRHEIAEEECRQTGLASHLRLELFGLFNYHFHFFLEARFLHLLNPLF